MTRRPKFTPLCAFCLAFGLASTAAFAQATHLSALREWMRNTEEAATFARKGDYIKAEQRLNLAIKEARPYFPDTERMLARSYCELAAVLYHQKRYAEAEPLARWALSVRDKDKKAKPEAVFQCVYTLGLIQGARKQYPEAEKLFKRSLALQENSLGPDHINSVIILNQLAIVYVVQSNYTDAEPMYVRALAIYERAAREESLDLAETAEEYAALLRLMKRNDDADHWHARALEIKDRLATKAAKARADRLEMGFRAFK